MEINDIEGLLAVLEGRPFFDPATSERTVTLAVGDFAAGWFASRTTNECPSPSAALAHVSV